MAKNKLKYALNVQKKIIHYFIIHGLKQSTIYKKKIECTYIVTCREVGLQ